MGWERTKAFTRELPPAPSILWWLLSGVLALTAGILLFILHASGTVKELTQFSIWSLSLTPSGCWLLLLCFRCWLWGRAIDEHAFLQKEARLGQQQWEEWAGRHLAILGSCILLPDGLTAAVIQSPASVVASRASLTRRIHDEQNPVHHCLAGVQTALRGLPPELPLRVTVVSDFPSAQLTETFATYWASLFPLRAPPVDITVTDTLSLARVEERLKQPLLTVDLILMMQLNGGELYSDWLASMLLTSDDVARKYQLTHPARLLRPMPLDMAAFDQDFTQFLETQTVACATGRVLADALAWEKRAASLMSVAMSCGAHWQPGDRLVLEKLCGIPGPLAPWLTVALASELVSLSKASLLTLFSSGTEHYVSTVTSGSEDANNR